MRRYSRDTLRRGSRRLAIALLLLPAGLAMGEAPLHERIDQTIEANHLGPLAPIAGDAAFLRRVTLDLTGMIPVAAEARAYLADQAPDKRAKLVEKLLATPEYARHMAHVFDVMLMERRGEKPLEYKGINEADWHEYLRRSFADNKPYDQLAREILSADGTDPALRPAARFYLEREVEPNLITRDVGRLFFGRDMQCAQCHNHPNIDDYHQADYYGLFAFFNRETAFADKDKVGFLAEKGEGEIGFKSVFTGYAVDRVVPHLPKEGPIVEPTFAKGSEYLVAPAQGVRPVPKYSRLAQLAAVATNGRSPGFNRNIVNRLWAQMFGRGIVHPADLHHPDNPPSHPALLALLADEFPAMKYDMRKFLAELAATRAYQRGCEVPAPSGLSPGETVKRIPALEAEQAKSAALASASAAVAEKTSTDLDTLRDTSAKLVAALAKFQTDQAELKKIVDKTAADLAAAQKDLPVKQEAAKVLAESLPKLQAAAQKLPNDQAVVQAAKQIEARSAALAAEATAAAQSVAQLTTQSQQTAAQLAALERTSPAGALEVAQQQLQVLEQLVPAAQRKAALDKMAAAEATRQVAEAKAIVEYERLAGAATASKVPADEEARAGAWNELADAWSKRFAWAALKPLSAEQLSWSLMQATGSVETQRAAAESALKKNPMFAGQPPAQQVVSIEKMMAGPIVSMFVSAPGPSAGFQPTVGQALFFENAEPMQALVRPAAGNLAERLTKIPDAALLADEMYLSVLTRYPDAAEKAEVAAHLNGRDADRGVALEEMLWALLSSTEFRFNH